jgi:uncharacterized protein (DUF58 family)
MQATMKFKGWFITLLTGLVLVLHLTAPNRVWVMLLIGLGLIQVIAYFWARSLQRNFLLTRERRYTWAQVGDRIEERFTINNQGFFPALWVEVIDSSTMPGYTASRVTGIGISTSHRWRTDGICTQRGVFQLGPTQANLGDPFGLFTVEQRYPTVVDFTIAPPVVDLPDIQIATRGHLGEEVPRPFSLAPTQPTATVRLYNSSDSLNRIHWPTTARRDDLYVRGMEELTAGDWWIVLDLDERIHQGEGLDSTLEKAILIAASMTERGLHDSHAVGLLAHGQDSIWMLPKSTSLQRWQIFRVLAQIRSGKLSLQDVLARSGQLIKRDASVIVITTAAYPNWLDSLLLLGRQGVVPTVVCLFDEQTRAAAEGLLQTLAMQNIRGHLIDHTTMKIPTPEELAGRWEWRILGMGRVVAVSRPEGSWERM